jgi:fumarylacetoacetase
VSRFQPREHAASSWVEGAAGSAYDADNLPYGIFSVGEAEPRVGTRIGNHVLDLTAVLGDSSFDQGSLNAFMAMGTGAWRVTRRRLVELLTDPERTEEVTRHLHPLGDVTMHHPFEVADYVDFYCSLQHATNVGRIFRPDGEALLPNWRHLPVGYHGRAGTVVVSGTDVRRPSGQRKAPDEDRPTFGPTRRLDIEAELGFVIGNSTHLGEQVTTAAFEEHVFGVTPLNDWSARDIQAWEYVPLGPFLGKSFATSISAWITPLDALGESRIDLPGQDPAPLEYLHVEEPAGYDVAFEVELNGEVVSRPPYAAMYWAPAQMLAHLTVNGASLRTGDLYASGTVSGDDREQRGSFLELSWGGREPFGSAQRTFLDDGDTVTLRATAPGALGGRIALGEVTGRILPALE